MHDEQVVIGNLVYDWNKTEKPYSTTKNIVQLFEEQVILHPSNIALSTSTGSLSYSDLNSKANQVSRQLEQWGLKPNSFSGIYLPRSSEMIIVLLAILKNGSAYVPINISDPADRILKICETAKLNFIITTASLKETIKYKIKNVVTLEDLILESEKQGIDNLDYQTTPDQAAYIIFTSGTTGIPKGVLVKHKPVINLIEWVNKTFQVKPIDKLIWTTSLSFDLSVYDIFGILAAGGTIRILNELEHLDPKSQLQIIQKENITFWDSAPQCFQRLIPYLKEKNINNSGLRLIFLSGDWIPLGLYEEIKLYFKNVMIVGLGGATEATVWSNYYIIDKVKPEWRSIPYGKPIQNAKYYILDTTLKHANIMVPGDLYIGGECLASEYYNDPELTRKKFIPDPFNPGGKLYRTGDKAQWMPDGNIEFLGREDLQVKIRGYRVELGEIKQAFLSLEKVKDCVVIPDRSDQQNIRLFLFYIPKDKSLDSFYLRNKLSKLLPDYMLPAGIFEIDCFPMTPNGKVDNKRLLEIGYDNMQKPGNRAENEKLTEIEQQLLEIWMEVLKTRDILSTDNFFDIGGNSLHAIHISKKIEKIFDVEFNLKNFYITPRIKDAATQIELLLITANSRVTQITQKIIEGEI